MAFDRQELEAYLDPARWQELARVKRASWLERHKRGPAAQMRAMAALRAFAHEVRGPPTAQERQADLDHHIRLSALMRRADFASR